MQLEDEFLPRFQVAAFDIISQVALFAHFYIVFIKISRANSEALQDNSLEMLNILTICKKNSFVARLWDKLNPPLAHMHVE